MCPSASDVSVITVNWNGKEHLELLIPSLDVLSCREIIVVDNASTDGSIEFLQNRFPQVRILQNSVNEGFAQPCNQGAAAASGRVLGFVNNDMRVDPSWLEAALPKLSPQQPCVASRILDWEGRKIDFNGSSLQYLGYAQQQDIGAPAGAADHQEKVLFPCGGAMLIDRKYFLEIGGFDESFFAIYEDVDLGWRIWVRGQEVGFAPDSIVYHRGHATFSRQGQHRTRYLMHRNALLTILKNYEEDTIRRVFPLAVFLAIRRAVLFSGVERESFYLWDNTRAGLEASDPLVETRLLDSLNHLVALDDIFRKLPEILKSRAKVQAARGRPDSEILRLFRDPFRSIVENPDYQQSEAMLVDWMGLDQIFGRQPSKPAEESTDHIEQQLHRLSREVARVQYWAQKNLDHPPPERDVPGVREFLRIWKRDGLRNAWLRFVGVVNRGL